MKDCFNCPICNRLTQVIFRDGRDFFILNGGSGDFSVVLCNHCQLGFSLPVLSNQELSKYYPDDYESFKPRKNLLAQLLKLKYKMDLGSINRETGNKKGLDVFEIGSGRGEFLNELNKRQFKVSGLEPGRSGVEFALKNYGLKLELGYIEDYNFSQEYDIIVIRHALEHVAQFYKVLEKIKIQGLKKGGLLFIKIPRLDSWEARWFGKFWSGFDLPRHRVHFTKRGVINILDKIGFVKIKERDERVPTDFIRSVKYYSLFGGRKIFRFLANIFSVLPNVIKLAVSQVIVVILSPLGSDRMIITVKK